MTPDNVVNIRDFSWRYRSSEALALNGVSLTVRQGECVVITGASGCGKSTLVSVMNGLIPHFHEGEYAGEVKVCGIDVLQGQTYEIACRVGSVFQDPRSQFFATTTSDEVAFGCENLGFPREKTTQRMNAAFSALAADDLRDRSIFSLSSGQKQKIAIASALAVDPELMVMDEPSANLDNEACRMLADAVAALKRNGRTVVVAEHRLSYLMGVADRVVVMERGRVVGELSPDEARVLSWESAAERGLRLPSLVNVPLNQLSGGEGSVREAPDFEARGLRVSYGRRQVLGEVGFSCVGMPGVTAIIGGNGAGKTTLVRTLCGLKREAEGEVCIGGRPSEAAKRRELSSFVMQDADYQLFTESVEAEVLFARTIKPAVRKRADAALAALGLDGFRTAHPLTLSGGQKQRLTIACALVDTSPLVFFDEPTSGLDGGTMREVARLVRSLAREGRRVFVVTHDFEFVAAACDRVLVVRAGVIADDFAVCEKNRERLCGWLGLGSGGGTEDDEG